MKLLRPRRVKDRQNTYIKLENKRIQQYIENGMIGDLDLGGSPITILPVELKYADGDLFLNGSKIKHIPDSLKYVGGTFHLDDTKITSLPTGLKVRESLYIRYTPLTNLPDDLRVGGDLSCAFSKLRKLPNNLYVGGDLYLRGTPFAHRLKGYVNGLSDKYIKSINLIVKGKIIWG